MSLAEATALSPRKPQGLLALAAEFARVEQLVLQLAEAKGGELDAELEQYLSQIKEQILAKPDQYKYIMDKLEDASARLKAQADEFLAAKRAADNVLEQMKGRIKDALQLLGVQEVAGDKWKFKLAKSAPRLMLDEVVVMRDAPEFIITKTIHELDKKRIKDRLEAGIEVPGARLEGGVGLRSSVVKAGD